MCQRFVGVLVLIASLLLSACGNDAGFTEQPVPKGYLRVLNAIPESSQLTVVVDSRSEGGLNFGELSSFINVLPTIPRSLSLLYIESGKIQTLIERKFTVQVDHDTTVILTGTLANPQSIDIENLPLVFNDADDFAEIQFVHASTSYIDPVSFMLVKAGDYTNPTIVTLNQFEVSTLQTPVAATDYELLALTELPATGTEPGADSILWRSGTTTLNAKTRRLFPLLDYFGPGGKQLRVSNIGEAGRAFFPAENLPAALRFGNMLPENPQVDLYLGDTLLISNQPFSSLSDYVQTDIRGPQDIKVTVAGDIDAVLAQGNSTITQGSFQSIVASGIEAAANFNYILTEDAVRLPAGQHLLTGVNAAPTVASLDFYLVPEGDSLDNINPNATPVPFLGIAGMSVAAGRYELVITELSTKTPLAGPVPVTIEDGKRYRFYVTETAGGGLPLQLVLIDDFN